MDSPAQFDCEAARALLVQIAEQGCEYGSLVRFCGEACKREQDWCSACKAAAFLGILPGNDTNGGIRQGKAATE